MTGFIFWAFIGILIIGFGIADFFAKKPAGFWANCKTIEVTDIKKYNRSVGIMFCIYGVVMILLGLPLLDEKYMPLILFSGIGIMAETIVMMVVYTVVIEPKYRKKG